MSLNLAHLAILHVVVTAALAGVVWVVQLAVYPLFDGVGADRFAAYHARYMRGITGVVAPLIGAEVLSAAGLLWLGVRGPLFLGSLVLIAMIWAITFAVEIPLHRKLGRGYDAEAHRHLVIANWARTLGWTARAVMVSCWLFTLSAF
jgi:hypothetical protein